ncbi:MAG: hypothetical protein ACM3SY_08610 [Candidatus Omnitrophota bacterium]
MTKYTFSIVFSIAAAVLHYFHAHVERTIMGWTNRNLAVSIIYGVFLAFFLALLFKAASKSNMELGAWFLAIGLTGFILFSQPVFLFKLTVLELFILGLIPALEAKKVKSILPFLIIPAAAALIELASNLSLRTAFSYSNAWRNALVALCGYISGCVFI